MENFLFFSDVVFQRPNVAGASADAAGQPLLLLPHSEEGVCHHRHDRHHRQHRHLCNVRRLLMKHPTVFGCRLQKRFL